jgi:hypothetical protein
MITARRSRAAVRFAMPFVLALAGAVRADVVQVETFAGGTLSSPFFHWSFEFDHPCCVEIVDVTGEDEFELHLRPNFAIVAFDLPPDYRVVSVSVVIRDFEGGFVGDLPTSKFLARAPRGDFVVRHADEIAAPQTLVIDRRARGQLFGLPLTIIDHVEMQAANEGNSVVPGIGAFYDDLTVVLRRYGDVDGDEVTGFEDLLAVLAAWGSCTACPEDLDVDGEVGLLDLLEVLANWSA